MEKRIKSTRITAQPKSFFDPMPSIIATFDDGSTETLFSYYPDEISFTDTELIGLTRAEALHRKFEKDKRYLQS